MSDPGAAAAFTNGREPLPPTWDGSEPATQFAVFQKNVRLWEFETELPENKRGVRLLRALTGIARQAADSLEFEKLTDVKGVAHIMACLEEQFKPHLELSLPRAFERAIYGQPRSHKEGIQEYIIRCERNFFLLEKEGVKLPDQAMGYVIFRQAALTENQELRFGAWANGKYDKATVVSCLRKLDKVIAEVKPKGSVAYLHEDDDALAEGDLDQETYATEYDEDPDDDFVYLTEGQAERMFDETELQVILATYHEVKRAIQSKQKGRQFYKGNVKGKGRGSPWQDYIKDKKKIHIEQLKLRTRCARCGTVGHWARECKSPPDARGAQSAASQSSKQTSNPSTSAGQSWYVSSPDSCSLHVSLFVGLTTSPTMAVVDTAAQDGLIGSVALNRLKEELKRCGLKIAWLPHKKARAHGVGGAAHVLGSAALPLGIHGNSGVLEVTVVEGDVPLLLPTKLLRELQATIDISQSCIHLHRLQVTARLESLPSGHIAMDVMNFGDSGFVCPADAVKAGLSDSDFRWCSGSEIEGETQMNCALINHVVGPVGAVPQSPEPAWARCGNACPAAAGQFETRRGKLARYAGQDTDGVAAAWARGVSSFMASCGFDGDAILSAVFRAVGPNHRHRHRARADEIQSEACGRQDGVPTSAGEVGASGKSAWSVGGVLRLPLQMGLAGGVCKSGSSQVEGEDSSQEGFGCGVNSRFSLGRLCEAAAGGEQAGAASPGTDRTQCLPEAGCGEVGAPQSTLGAGEQCELEGGSALETGSHDVAELGPQSRSVCFEGQTAASCGRMRSDRDDDGRVCGDGVGNNILREQELSQWRDVGVCRGQTTSELGVGRVETVDQRAGAGGLGETSAEGVTAQEDPISGQEVWVKLKGQRMHEAVKRWKDAPGYEPKEIYVMQDAKHYRVENYEDLGLEDECIIRMGLTAKMQCEDLVEDEFSDTALSKAQKTKLRRAIQQAEPECFPVAVAEVFSPPRIALEASRQGLSTGGSYDLLTGYDLLDAGDRRRMWQELDRDDPELVVNSPPCTAFCPLQAWNLPRMDFEKAVVLIGDGLECLKVASDVAYWQHQRGKIWLLEHPKPSKAWDEEPLQRLLRLEGIYVCVSDMCAYDMRVKDGLNKKPTRWVTNSWHLAMELQQRCTGDHVHEPLTHGKAALAAMYPPALCRAIVRGLKRHLRWKNQEPVAVPEADVVIDTFAVERGAPQPADDVEDQDELLPEEIRVVRAEKERLSRGIAAVSDEDKAKVSKLHANLGHPSKDSFVRFLRAGRVREEVVRWYIKDFRCATCDSHVLPKAPRPAVVPKCYRPGVAVGMDLFYIPDPLNQKSLPVLNVVDLGTSYQMIQLIGDKSPFTIWRAFWKTWCRTFGMPQYISLDAGLEFRGDFNRWCADFGTLVFRAAARSPWQQGKVERHGGLMKSMIEKARESTSIATVEELKALLYECEAAKNRFMNRSGYSPVQRQIGQWPRLPGSLMSDEILDPALQVQDVSEEFDRTLELRQIAQDAFVKLASKDAAVKALRARSRAQRVFKTGDVVYVFRSLRRKKQVHQRPEAERGLGIGRRATWIGPGHVLAMEGSVVWINMFGELWKAASEQVREATTVEKLGVEVVAEDFSEMQDRLKRSSRRAGFRDVTADAEEMQEENEVDQEGMARGQPRVRFEDEENPYSPSLGPAEAPGEEPTALDLSGPIDHSDTAVDPEFAELFRPDPMPETHGRRVAQRTEERRASNATVEEPDEEVSLVEPNLADEQQVFDEQAEEEAVSGIEQSIAHNEALDGVPLTYGRAQNKAKGRWREMAPYVAEVFFQGDNEVEETLEEPTHDYWVYDSHRQVLQRHHVHWRKALFNPMTSDQSPVPLRAIKKSRRTKRVCRLGQSEEIQDEWSPFAKKEERLSWWRGITEFDVDSHFLSHGPSFMAKKRGEGEVFPHEIPTEEWPEWKLRDAEEFQKIVDSGALRVLSVEESQRVREELGREGKLDRILPTRMVRRYKPGDAPGAPRVKKSRFCIRGDKDPDIADLSRFAPTVTTSNLQVLIQAAINKNFNGVIGDLKSAFTQSLPLFRKGGKLYCRSVGGSMPGLEEDQLAEIVLGCYGLCDAPMHWRKTLVSFLINELGYRQSALDPCTYLLHGEDPQNPGESQLLGMVAVEIDDLLDVWK
eukprot:s238_g35.t1